MKTYLMPAIKLTIIFLVITAVIYPLTIAAIGKLTPGKGDGVTVQYKGRTVGYANIGQKFTKDEYFWSRPSAVDYNAAGSGGSNKGTNNPDYLAEVKTRIDTFLLKNPTVKRSEVPSDLVTASGSGIDPNISVEGAKVQVDRIAKTRNIEKEKVLAVIEKTKQEPLLGCLGTEKINVLALNIALDEF